MLEWWARIKLDDGGSLVLKPGWKWEIEGEGEGAAHVALELAKLESVGYCYSPGYGWPGAHLASIVARKLEAELVLPDYPKQPPGTVN